MSLRCSYTEGMFANEPLGEYATHASIYELEATCYHEAGHAVIDYLQGRPLQSVGVFGHVDGDTVSYGGEVKCKGKDAVRIHYRYRPLHFKHGLSAVAGPAAELRFKHDNGIPLRLLGASEGDHVTIDRIGKAIEDHGRSRFAFQRLVWSRAQRLISLPDVWHAISAVAQVLHDEAIGEIDLDADGTHWAYIEPRAVYSACRRAGLRRGQLVA